MSHKNTTKPDGQLVGNVTPQSEAPVSYLAQEYELWQALFQAQPALTQRFFEVQAEALADALIQPLSHTRFAFPERVVVTVSVHGKAEVTSSIPPE